MRPPSARRTANSPPRSERPPVDRYLSPVGQDHLLAILATTLTVILVLICAGVL